MATTNNGVPSSGFTVDIAEILRRIKAKQEGQDVKGVLLVNLPETDNSTNKFSITTFLLLGALAFIIFKRR